MNLQNQRLYKAFRQIIAADEMREIRRVDHEEAIEELEKAKQEAVLLIQELPKEQIEELARLPIEDSEIILTIDYTPPLPKPVGIDIQRRTGRRQLFEFMEDKKEERTDG